MRDFLCVKVKQCQILPGLPQAYYPQASRRAYEEKTHPCYGVGTKKGLIYKAFREHFLWRQEIYP